MVRTGKIYYLHVGQGKSGNANYFFSTEPDGPLVNSVPEGFEIDENVGGHAFLRRKQPKLITDEELAIVKEALKRHAEEWRYRVEIKKTAVIIYEAPDNTAGLERIALPWISKATIKQALLQRTDGLGRRALLPIARMGLAPSPNTLDVLTAPEVIPVLFEPPLLALGLADLPALRMVAELLVVTVAPIRQE